VRRRVGSRRSRDNDAAEKDGSSGMALGGALCDLSGREFWRFLRVRKKWWLAPIVVLLLTLGLILFLTEGSALAPFIYSLF
jgi:uncharacterized protein DUF5989